MTDWTTLEGRDHRGTQIIAGDDAHRQEVSSLSNSNTESDRTTEDAHVDYANGHLDTSGADLEKDLVDPENLNPSISVHAIIA